MSTTAGREVATAYATIIPRAPQFSRKLEQEIGPGLRRAGDRAGLDLSEALNRRLSRDIDGDSIGEEVGSDLTDAIIDELSSRQLDVESQRLGKRLGSRLGEAAGDEIEDEVEDGLEDGTDGGREAGRGFGNDFQRGFSGAISGLGRGIRRAALAGAGIAGGATALGGVLAADFIKDSIVAATDLNEIIAATGELFGSGADEAERFAETRAEAFNLTRAEALGGLTTFGLFTNLVTDDDEESVERAIELTERAADIGSFFNATAEEVQGAISGALRGEFEPIRRFGVLLSADALAASALSAGLVEAEVDTTKLADAQLKLREAQEKVRRVTEDGTSSQLEREQADIGVLQAEEALAALLEGKVPDLTAAQRVEAARLEVLRQTEVAQGDLARTAEGTANQERALTTAIERQKEELGQELLPIYNEFLTLLLDEGIPVLEDFTRYVEENKEELATYALAFAATLLRLSGGVLRFGGFATQFVGNLQIIGAGIQLFVANTIEELARLPESVQLNLFGQVITDDDVAALKEAADATFETGENTVRAGEEMVKAADEADRLAGQLDALSREIQIPVDFQFDPSQLAILGNPGASVPRGENFNPDAPGSVGLPFGSGSGFGGSFGGPVSITVRDADGVLTGNVRGQIDSTLTAAQRAARNKAAGAT